MSATPRSSIIAKVEHKTLTDLIKRDKRLDDRSFTEYRNIKLETGLIEKANGSAFIELGNTKVLVGIKVSLGEPFSDTPDKGVLTVNAELVPIAFPLFEPGPPSENAIELARVVAIISRIFQINLNQLKCNVGLSLSVIQNNQV